MYITTYDAFNRPTLNTYQYGSNTAITLAEYAYDSYPAWAPAFAAESGYVSTSDKDTRTRGLPTAERVTLLPGGVSPSALTTSNTAAKTARAFYYDAKGNLRQVAQADATGGTTRISSSYGFAGNLVSERQRTSPGSGQTEHTLDKNFLYDGRLRRIISTATLDGGSQALLGTIPDELGRLGTAGRHNNVETSQYTYTLQGWLSGNCSTSWEETLRYESPSRTATDALPGKAGLITEWTQQQKGTSADGATTAETYAYSYDKAGRLTGSLRYIGTSTSAVNTLTEQNITYDRSGNLLTLNRYDASSGTTPSESLSFSYSGPKRTGWTYDSHGNVTSDPVGSTTVAWNVLDMPSTISSGTAGVLRSYLADGTLVQVSDGSTTRLYLGDMVFNQTSGTTSLESAAWDGGLLLPGSGTDKVLYYVTDHLGSVRVVKDGSGNIRQRYDYYPYGSVARNWSSSSTSTPDKRYRFGGKEISGTALGALSSGADKYLDFGARLYLPRTAMWLSQDPMAEKYYSLTPYMYCAGSPANLVDPEGEDIWTINSNGEIVWKQSSKNHFLYLVDDAGNLTNTFIQVYDGNLLLDLENAKGKVEINKEEKSLFMTQSNKADDIFRIFKFASDHTNKEWVVHRNGKIYTLGTALHSRSAAGYQDYGLSLPDASIHSHPNEASNPIKEKESMGYWRDQDFTTYSGDAFNARHFARPLYNYVYFSESHRIYQIGKSYPIYIKRIQSYKGFYFGTLNTR